MNKHIELVKKWLSDRDSVTLEELKANKDAAYAAYGVDGVANAAYYVAANAAFDATYYAAVHAVNAAYYAAYTTYYAAAVHAVNAEYWVKEYEELTK